MLSESEYIAEGLDIEYNSNRSNTSDDGTDNKSYGYNNDNEHSDSLNSINKLKIRPIEPQLQTKISILIVDRKYSLAIELKDDSICK